VKRAFDVHIACTRGNQERVFDPGLVHHAKVLRDPDAFAHFGAHPDLLLEMVVDPGLIVADFDRRIEIADDIDMA
jgi:hypothetical protein